MELWWEERHTDRETAGVGRGDSMLHLKNESSSPSSPQTHFLFVANLSDSLLSDGFTGGGWDGRAEKKTFTGQTFTNPPPPPPPLISASLHNECKGFLPHLKKRGLWQWKWDKNKKDWSLPPSSVSFQSTWMAEPMQETAWSSGGLVDGDQLHGWSSRQICSFVKKLWTWVNSAAMHHFRENTCLSSSCSLRVVSLFTQTCRL